MRTGDAGDEALVAAARRGDTDAFRQLYERHVPGVFALVRSLVGDRELAEDVTQTAFVKAWESLPRLRQGEALKVWLRQIARRVAVDEMRRRRVVVRSLDDPESEWEEPPSANGSPEGVAEQAELEGRVRAAIAELPPHHQAVVALYHLDGLEVRDVAAALGLPLGTVLSRLSRARTALRAKLASFVEPS